MWYRNRQAARVLETPEYVFHTTDQTFDHPWVNTDPNANAADMLGAGYGSDKFGRGFYTTQNPTVMQGYSNSLQSEQTRRRSLLGDEADEDTPNVTRRQRLPRGFKLLQHDNIPLDEFHDLFAKFNQRYFGGQLQMPRRFQYGPPIEFKAVGDEDDEDEEEEEEEPEDFYRYHHIRQAVIEAIQQAVQELPYGERVRRFPHYPEFQKTLFGNHSPYAMNDYMREIGYDGMEYGPSTVRARSWIDPTQGNNILVWNHAAINHPREFLQNRFRGTPLSEQAQDPSSVLGDRTETKEWNDWKADKQSDLEYKLLGIYQNGFQTVVGGKPTTLIGKQRAWVINGLLKVAQSYWRTAATDWYSAKGEALVLDPQHTVKISNQMIPMPPFALPSFLADKKFRTILIETSGKSRRMEFLGKIVEGGYKINDVDFSDVREAVDYWLGLRRQ